MKIKCRNYSARRDDGAQRMTIRRDDGAHHLKDLRAICFSDFTMENDWVAGYKDVITADV